MGVNGTTTGNYAIQSVAGSAPTISGNMITGINNTGAEFYLSVTFDRGSDSFTQRYRFKK